MSLIPPFDHNHVLPPYLGSPVELSQLSPYESNIIDLCQRFATSKQRKEILLGLIGFREKMTLFNIIEGFQWIDGSFVENIEASENRPPKDIDVLTFHRKLSSEDEGNVLGNFQEFYFSQESKRLFNVDHYPVDIEFDPFATVELTRYWAQLFTHNRNRVWKGIIKLPINTPNDDQQALNYLNSLGL